MKTKEAQVHAIRINYYSSAGVLKRNTLDLNTTQQRIAVRRSTRDVFRSVFRDLRAGRVV